MARDRVINVKLYKTDDYDKFNFIASNRNVSEFHVREIMEEIQRNDLTVENPVKINEAFDIIEGQHTFLACKRLNIPVIYRFTNMMDSDIGLFNSVQKSWTYTDVLNHFCVKGYDDYKTLYEFYKRYPYPISTLVILFTGENTNKVLKDFRRGDFIITQNVDGVQRILNQLTEFKQFDDKVYRHKTFVLAYFDILTHPDFEHEKFVHKLSVIPERFSKCNNQKDYVRMVEDIFNYKNRNIIRLW